jgi:peptide deformylase
MTGIRPSEQMRDLGVVQRGDAVLTELTRPFDLPAEKSVATRIVDHMVATMHRIRRVHPFAKGSGLAAPQIGVARSVAVVLPAEPGASHIVLCNPRIVDSCDVTDEQYEGCLSFFDVRGLVPRPLQITVTYVSLDGEPTRAVFHRGLARLVNHEVDHLNGILYPTRMLPGVDLLPVEKYHQLGQAWSYEQ